MPSLAMPNLAGLRIRPFGDGVDLEQLELCVVGEQRLDRVERGIDRSVAGGRRRAQAKQEAAPPPSQVTITDCVQLERHLWQSTSAGDRAPAEERHAGL